MLVLVVMISHMTTDSEQALEVLRTVWQGQPSLAPDLELDEATHEVRRAGNLLDLSPTEFLLTRYLLINADRVVSKSQILDHVWEYDFRGDAGIVETYISYLRKKIDIYDPPLIHTIRGVGYRLRVPSEK